MGPDPFNKKIRLFPAARNQGREAAVASMLRAAAGNHVVPVTVGGQNLTADEGIAPHPAVAYRILLDEQTEAKLKVSPRASTPRKKRKASAGVDRGRGT